MSHLCLILRTISISFCRRFSCSFCFFLQFTSFIHSLPFSIMKLELGMFRCARGSEFVYHFTLLECYSGKEKFGFLRGWFMIFSTFCLIGWKILGINYLGYVVLILICIFILSRLHSFSSNWNYAFSLACVLDFTFSDIVKCFWSLDFITKQ